MGTTVEGVAGNISKAANTAGKHTNVFGAGLFAGIKAYLAGKSDDVHGAGQSEVADEVAAS